ncbi:MAG: SDR family oxidoreductase [Thaumarchaeota archaeon]|nr:SDR family oxidoreductase [Nitrososphaerota archaeon]
MVETIDLSGSVAIVTGAGSGIGRATALVLAHSGADVVIPDVNLEGAEHTASEVRKLGRRAIAIKTDVSQASDIQGMVGTVMDEFSQVDILVNNAGIGTKTRKPFYEQPESEWNEMLSVDLKGTWLCAKAVSLEMIKKKKGRIVNISSIAGKVALRLQSDYDSAKAGVIRLTEVMAMELAPFGIAVNCVCPGSVRTQATEKVLYSDETWKQKMLTYIPMGRPAEPEEIGYAVLYLASPKLASYVTGSTLVVDGGWTAGNQIRDV